MASKKKAGYWAYMDRFGQIWRFRTKKRASTFARAGHEKNWSKKIIFMDFLKF